MREKWRLPTAGIILGILFLIVFFAGRASVPSSTLAETTTTATATVISTVQNASFLVPFLTIPVGQLQYLQNFTYANNIVRVGYTPGAINVWYMKGHDAILVIITDCLFSNMTGQETALLWNNPNHALLMSGPFVPTRSSILYLYLIPSGGAYAG